MGEGGAGRAVWQEPDGLHGTLDRYGPGWCVTITRPGVPGAAAAVRATRADAVDAVAECLAAWREGEARRMGRVGRG